MGLGSQEGHCCKGRALEKGECTSQISAQRGFSAVGARADLDRAVGSRLGFPLGLQSHARLRLQLTAGRQNWVAA